MPARLIPLLFATLLAVPVAAQPSAPALLDAWLADWRRASAGVDAVVLGEQSTWTIDGPRGRMTITSEGTVRFGRGGPPQREIERVTVDGQEAEHDWWRRSGRRWGRAFGPAGREVHAPPGLPGPLLARARPLGIAADRVDGEPAWRLALDLADDRADAWFSRDAAPRLLVLRVEGRRPRGGRFRREVRFARADGLDLPVTAETSFTARQRRRLREYYITLTAAVRYGRPDLRR